MTRAEAIKREIASIDFALKAQGLPTYSAIREQRDELLAALKEIADGCVAYRPGHVNYSDNRTKEEIRVIADAARFA